MALDGFQAIGFEGLGMGSEGIAATKISKVGFKVCLDAIRDQTLIDPVKPVIIARFCQFDLRPALAAMKVNAFVPDAADGLMTCAGLVTNASVSSASR